MAKTHLIIDGATLKWEVPSYLRNADSDYLVEAVVLALRAQHVTVIKFKDVERREE